jgi:osmotically-inducible protein OsmY
MILYVTALVSALSLLTSCVPAVIGAGAAAGVVAAQERTVGQTVDDYAIYLKVKALFTESGKKGLLNDVNVEVVEGHVHLTGTAVSPEARLDAVRLAWKPDGVVQVTNDIVITDTASAKEYAKDKWIFTQIKSRLLLEKHIRSVNYSVEVVRSTVYVMGIAKNETEHRRVTEICRSIKGVKNVISYVLVRKS